MALLLTTTGTDIEINPLDWPRCSRCGMPVERFWIVDTDSSMILVAVCHGKEQLVTVPNESLASMVGSYIDIGQAFEEDEQ